MSRTIFEKKLIDSFTDSENHFTYRSDKRLNTLSNIKKQIINTPEFFTGALDELVDHAELREEMAKRIYEKLYAYYQARGYTSRNPNYGRLTLERIILTLVFELSATYNQNQPNTEFILETLDTDIQRFYSYIQYEAPLAAFFENYA